MFCRPVDWIVVSLDCICKSFKGVKFDVVLLLMGFSWVPKVSNEIFLRFRCCLAIYGGVWCLLIGWRFANSVGMLWVNPVPQFYYFLEFRMLKRIGVGFDEHIILTENWMVGLERTWKIIANSERCCGFKLTVSTCGFKWLFGRGCYLNFQKVWMSLIFRLLA